MSKQLFVDPNEVRKPGYITFEDIPSCQYQKTVKDELGNFTKEEFINIYRDMLTLREFETMINEIKINGKYLGVSYNHPGPAHLSIGEEAAAVGEAFNLTVDDMIFGSHRAHSDILAKGLSAIEKLSDDELMNVMKNFLGGNYAALIDLIVKGKIKGIVGVVGCSNLRAKGHDVFTVEMTKQLIANDILVVTAGCTSGGLANVGLMSREAADLAGPGLSEVCKALGIPPVLNFGPCLAIGRIEQVCCDIASELGVDLPQLPVVVSAPQWLEEQALADGSYALTLGLPLHLALAPFVTGSPVIVETLCNTMKDLTGGQLFIDTEVDSTVAKIGEIIEEKRKGLGL